MRYKRGQVSISQDRDIPVLILIRNARAIRLTQLYENLILGGYEPNRRTAYWRMKRLIDSGLVETLTGLRFVGDTVYTITRTGLALLESHGHTLLALGTFSRTLLHQSDAIHMIELNEIRLSLLRAGCLISWQGELEILSQNLVLYGEGVKDYDAVVAVGVDGKKATFALEYERTAKSSARYKEIRQAIESDHRVDLVLYLTPSQELMYLLTRELAGMRKQLAFGIANHFKAAQLSSPAYTHEEARSIPFRDLLTRRLAGDQQLPISAA